MKRILVLILLCSMGVFSVHTKGGYAQDVTSVTPDATQQRSDETLRYYELEKKLREGRSPEKEGIIDETLETRKAQPQSDEKVIFVKEVRTSRSEILAEEEIQQITDKYEGRNASINDLLDIVDSINELYRTKYRAVAKAILPPQKIEDGVVEIRLVEGRVGDILVEDSRYTKESFFRNWLSSGKDDLINLDNLDKELSFFNSINDVKLKVVLKPGKEFGTTDYVLKVVEPQKHESCIFMDNAGRDEIGLTRVGVWETDTSLLGYRDRFTIGGVLARGTTYTYLSYDFPVGTLGTRLGLSYDYSRISVKFGLLEKLNIGGEYHDLGIHAEHPLMVKRNSALRASVAFNYKKSNTEADDFTLFETRTKIVKLGTECQYFSRSGSWYSGHYLTGGFGKGGDKKKFLTYNGDCVRMLLLKAGMFALFRGKVQLSNSELLPASDRLQLGGISTVRGYSEGLLAGNNGYFLSAELNFPLRFRKSDNDGNPLRDRLSGFIFADHGGTFHLKDNGKDDSGNLTSIGLGLNFIVTKEYT